MIRLQNILAPSDFSAAARLAVERAARLAALSGARLTLQHVVSSGALDLLRQLLGSQPGDLQQRLLDEARDELQVLAGELYAAHGVSPAVHFSAGNALAEITSHADALDADLLVLGARGASLVRDLAVGSTTERVLRKSGRPLLVVRGAVEHDYRRVLLPVDFSPRSRQAIALARELAPQAELVLLHAFEVPFEGRLRHAGISDAELAGLQANARQEALGHMAELLAACQLPLEAVTTVVVHGDASVQILDQGQLHGCELIVIGKRGQGPFEELLLGSVTKHILSQARGDVLAI